MTDTLIEKIAQLFKEATDSASAQGCRTPDDVCEMMARTAIGYIKQQAARPPLYVHGNISTTVGDVRKPEEWVITERSPSEISVNEEAIRILLINTLLDVLLGNKEANAIVACLRPYLRGGSTVGIQPEKATSPVSTTAPQATTMRESVTGWQPIDKAPEDKQTIAWLSGNSDYPDMTVRAYKSKGKWRWYESDEIIGGHITIKGWQPWPEPPEIEGGA